MKKITKSIWLLFTMCIITTPILVSCGKKNDTIVQDSGSSNGNDGLGGVEPPINPDLSWPTGFGDEGTTASGIHTTNFKNIVDSLGLSPTTRLSKHSNTTLQNKLDESRDFIGVKLSIEKGDEELGELSLEVTGNYKGQEITPTVINLTGFVSRTDLESTRFTVDSKDFNMNQYFTDLKTKDFFTNLSSKNVYTEFKKYLQKDFWKFSNRTFTFQDVLTGFGIKDELVDYSQKISQSGSSKLQFDINYKKYNGTSWIAENKSRRTFINFLFENSTFPTKDDLLYYLLENYVDPKKIDNLNNYASNYTSILMTPNFENEFCDTVLNRSRLEKDKEKYLVKYFSQSTHKDFKLSASKNSMNYNDYLGTIEVDVSLSFGNNQSNKTRKFNILTKDKLRKFIPFTNESNPTTESTGRWHKIADSSTVTKIVKNEIKKIFPTRNDFENYLKNQGSKPKYMFNHVPLIELPVLYYYDWDHQTLNSRKDFYTRSLVSNENSLLRIFSSSVDIQQSPNSFYNFFSRSKNGLYEIRNKKSFRIESISIKKITESPENMGKLEYVHPAVTYTSKFQIEIELGNWSTGKQTWTYPWEHVIVFSSLADIYK